MLLAFAMQSSFAADSNDLPQQPTAENQAVLLAKFRQSILVATQRYKHYPEYALNQGRSGKVLIRIVIAPDGSTKSYSIIESSGHDALDSAAYQMVRKGRPMVVEPPGLRGNEFSIDIPVVFEPSEAR